MKPEQHVRAVIAAIPGSNFYRSKRGVPMALCGKRSVCWFATGNFYRVFLNAEDGTTQRFDFPTLEGVVDHFREVFEQAVPPLGVALTDVPVDARTSAYFD